MADKPTPGFVRVARWDADAEEADFRVGYASESDPDDAYRCATWMPFRTEADAREFARRWNCHAELVAALETMAKEVLMVTEDCNMDDTAVSRLESIVADGDVVLAKAKGTP